MSKEIKTLAIATILAASASAAFAQSPPPYSGGYGGYGGYGPPSPVAPYGDANPSYTGGYPNVGNCRVVRNQYVSPSDGRAIPRAYVDCD